MGDVGVSRPASFVAVFAVPEFRAMWSAEVLSLVGDQLARVAISVLVFQRTDSAGLTYALTYGIAGSGLIVVQGSGLGSAGAVAALVGSSAATITIAGSAGAVFAVLAAWSWRRSHAADAVMTD